MERQKVWVPDPVDGFILGTIHDIGHNGEATIFTADSRHSKLTCHLERVYYAEQHDKTDVEDNCALMYLNPATLLNNIRTRYNKDKIYTFVANILIAVNPYCEIKDLYSSKTIKSYQGKSLGVLPPHVFSIADKSFRDMKVLKQSQSIIVSGESGAGKTESTKYLLRYLCELWGTTAGPIEQKILDANPVMEAFGNAKTTRNNNSSRFGKFIEVHFDSRCQVVGGFISHYLLEKSRICRQSEHERNYHVFYLLCAGAPDTLREQLNITKPDDFHYLNSGCTQYFTTSVSEKKLNNSQKSQSHLTKGGLRDTMLDDVEDFTNMDTALGRLGLSDTERLNIYTMVASVLHLGNVAFEDDPDDTKGGCQVCGNSEKSLATAAKLMGVDPGELRQALVSRVMQSSRGGLKGTVIMVPLKVYEANNARDALAKALYSNLFDYIVQRINKSIPFKASSYYIGVLDIAGFEYFTVNSFEQFCINYCNEKLQQFFNERILKDEQDLYQKEALQVPKIEFRDNQDCIDLIECKGTGIFAILDEESKLPKPSAEHFTMEVHQKWAGHFRLALPRTSRLKAHRDTRDNEGFMIRHFAGAVCYRTGQFIEKNNDALHASLEGLIQESRNPFLQGLFASSSNMSQQKGKLAFSSVGSKFRTQLGELMDKLKSTGTNFIRCIKPNQKMVDHQFEGGSILSQLECSGMTSVMELMQNGFPSRVPFTDLYNMYHRYLPPKLAKLEPRVFCKALLKALGMTENEYRFGVTKVFFRPGKFVEFDSIMKSDPENLASMVAKVHRWLLTSEWKKTQWCALSVIKLKYKILYRRACLITIQKNVRMFLAKRIHQPRYKGIAKINSLQAKLLQMEASIGQLKKDKQSSLSELKKLQADMTSAIQKIKRDEKIKPAEVDKMYTHLLNTTNSQMNQLQKKVQEQKNAEEQERLRKIQEEMEKEKRRKEEEERRKREEEENRRRKIEMEARRKAEEEERKRQEEEDRKAAAVLQAQLEKEALENTRYREQLEQERRDHELALRLAQETNDQLEEMSPQDNRRSACTEIRSLPPNKLNRSELVRSVQAAQGKQKYDLSKWKYSELRDTINTSCDIELLEACRIEFHRRLKVYHAWKAKNKKKTTMDENERAPRSVMDAATRVPRAAVKTPINMTSQRYFRIPFVRSTAASSLTGGNESTSGNKRGWWYAHFDGQYVARQMELHPEKPAILLVAGVDDMQMCELSLDETGLTRKRGAEILEHEFNREWERHGGKEYVAPANRKK